MLCTKQEYKDTIPIAVLEYHRRKVKIVGSHSGDRLFPNLSKQDNGQINTKMINNKGLVPLVDMLEMIHSDEIGDYIPKGFYMAPDFTILPEIGEKFDLRNFGKYELLVSCNGQLEKIKFGVKELLLKNANSINFPGVDVDIMNIKTLFSFPFGIDHSIVGSSLWNSICVRRCYVNKPGTKKQGTFEVTNVYLSADNLRCSSPNVDVYRDKERGIFVPVVEVPNRVLRWNIYKDNSQPEVSTGEKVIINFTKELIDTRIGYMEYLD